MSKYTILNNILEDIRTSKCTSNINAFKENMYDYSLEELEQVKCELEKNFYFGQHGVNDIAWFNLKQIIVEVINSKNKK